jgi:hypothetical protein
MQVFLPRLFSLLGFGLFGIELPQDLDVLLVLLDLGNKFLPLLYLFLSQLVKFCPEDIVFLVNCLQIDHFRFEVFVFIPELSY